MKALAGRRPEMLANLGVTLSATFWGLFWLPLRGLSGAGIGERWTAVTVFASVTLALLPIALWRWRRLRAGGLALVWTGLLTGAAFALYSASLLMTEVVRTQLLFYLSPAWSTLLGLAFLGERLTANRALSLVLGFSGLLVILGLGTQLPWPRNVGDWLALASGLCWAFGALRLYRSSGVAPFEQTFMFGAGALLVSLVVLALPLGAATAAPAPEVLCAAWPWFVFFGLCLAPVNFLTIWPATVLTPARVGILFMFEVVVGVSSAAWLAGEPFGWREMLGTVLIVGAGLAEVWRYRQPAKAPGRP